MKYTQTENAMSKFYHSLNILFKSYNAIVNSKY